MEKKSIEKDNSDTDYQAYRQQSNRQKAKIVLARSQFEKSLLEKE